MAQTAEKCDVRLESRAGAVQSGTLQNEHKVRTPVTGGSTVTGAGGCLSPDFTSW